MGIDIKPTGRDQMNENDMVMESDQEPQRLLPIQQLGQELNRVFQKVQLYDDPMIFSSQGTHNTSYIKPLSDKLLHNLEVSFKYDLRKGAEQVFIGKIRTRMLRELIDDLRKIE